MFKYKGLMCDKGVVWYRDPCDIKVMMRTTERFVEMNKTKSIISEAAAACDVEIDWSFSGRPVGQSDGQARLAPGEAEGEITQFELNTVDGVDILDILSNIDERFRGQIINVERFIKKGVTAVWMENPVITMDDQGNCLKASDKPLFCGFNVITELNVQNTGIETPLEILSKYSNEEFSMGAVITSAGGKAAQWSTRLPKLGHQLEQLNSRC